MTTEMIYPDGTSGFIGPTIGMYALLGYIDKHPEYKALNQTDILNGVIEADQYDALLQELKAIKCKGDCPVITNFIAGLEEAKASGEEWVMMS